MANHPRSPSQGVHNIRGVPKRTSIRDICKAYKSLITRWHLKKNSSPNKSKVDAKRKAIIQDFEAIKEQKQEEESMNGVHHEFRYNNGERMGGGGGDSASSRGGLYKNRSVDDYFNNSIPSFSRSGSRRSQTPTRAAAQASLLKSMSRSSRRSTSTDAAAFPSSLSRSASRRSSSSTTPIMFSNSNGLMKPPAIQKKLECTLEELCFGCIKKIKITRDVATNTGKIIQEDELLTIKVKPGWKNGTKITFEGMGDERPGTYPADITFLVAEKQHPLFMREGDDLELAVEIPLVKALTGCNFSIPLLGGERMSLTISDIIYPGYEKVIAGQGMPNSKEQGKRGNLRIVFLIEFPAELTDEQRSNVFSILQDSC